MNRFDWFALAAAAVATYLSVGPTTAAWEIYVVREELFDQQTALAIVAWVLANYGVIAIAAGFWRWSKRARHAWIPHLLFLPVAYLAFRYSSDLLLHALNARDFDSTIGAPISAGMILLFPALLGYLAAVIYTHLSASRAPAPAA